MADDVTLNPGAGGSAVATDDIGGRHFQRVKIVLGADGINEGDVASTNHLPVDVGNFPATQAVSVASLPLPSGAATAAKQPALGTAGTPSADVISVQGVASGTALKVDGSAVTQPVSGTVAVSNFPATQAVSAASLPLPSGAATSAKQPALGTSGTPSADVITVQGATGMTALKVDGSGVTQPVSGSVSVSNFPATQPISASALPLPTGAATETTLASLNTKTPAVGQAAMSASRPVVIASDQSNLPVMPQAPSATGSISALNGAVTLNVLGNGGAAVDLRGTFTATVTFQGTIDGTNWFSLVATPVASAANVATVSTATAAGAWFVMCAGCVSIRATATAYTSGTITVVLRAMTSVPWVYQAPIGATNAVTISSGTVTTVSTVSAQTPVTPTTTFTNSAATTNATSIKASAGTLWSIVVNNVNAAARYLKIYNLATAPTVGTSTPAFTVAIPATSTVTLAFGANGMRFATGIALAITGAMADADTTAVAANEIKVATTFT